MGEVVVLEGQNAGELNEDKENPNIVACSSTTTVKGEVKSKIRRRQGYVRF